MRSTYRIIDFTFTNILPVGGVWVPNRLVLHTDGNPRPHTALGALQWGDRTRAFSIHWYVEGETVYRGVPENRLAWHVKEFRKAETLGYDVTWPGVTGKRGDIRAIGIEHVMQPDGTWDQATRITSVLLGADILRRTPTLQVFEHADFDPWTRHHDVGVALNVADWKMDVLDVMAGLEPWRVVGLTASPALAVRSVPPAVQHDAEMAAFRARMQHLEEQQGALSERQLRHEAKVHH